MIGHRPQVCYPAFGWQPAGERVDKITLGDNKTLDCRIHLFKKSEPENQAVVVLNYYILQGRHTTEWTDFWGVKWRMPNLMKNPEFYVLQVQVNGLTGDLLHVESMEGTLKEFAAGAASLVRSLLPGALEDPGNGR